MFGKRFNILPINVIVIGCGGTGSRVVPLIAQYMSTLPTLMTPTLTLIDGDDVEAKNLSRQNFISEDVGQMKSTVLAQRYGEAYGINVISIPKFYNMSVEVELTNSINPQDAWFTFLYKELRASGVDDSVINLVTDRPQIIISCVDSIPARLSIFTDIVNDSYCRRGYRRSGYLDKGLECSGVLNRVIIDAGNENTYGQVRIFNPVFVSRDEVTKVGTVNKVDKYIRDNNLVIANPNEVIDVPFLPIPFGAYARALVNVSAADRSCADLDQTMAVNVQMAIGIFQMYQNLAMNHPFKYHTWYYDIHNGNSQDRINMGYLERSCFTLESSYGNEFCPLGKPGDVLTGTYTGDDPFLIEFNKLPGTVRDVFNMIAEDHAGYTLNSKRFFDHMRLLMKVAFDDGRITKCDEAIMAIIRGKAVTA